MRMYERFAALYDDLMRDVDYAAWSAYLVSLLQEHGVNQGETICECACGTGELSVRLSRAGYRVIGSDASGDMLNVAEEKARHAGVTVPFIMQDMRALSLHKPVSAVVCACDGVNYLPTQADLMRFFTAVSHALKENGLLLFDVSSAYKLEFVLGGQTFGDDTKRATYLWQNCFDSESRLLEMNLAFFLPQKNGLYERFDERQIQRAFTVCELTNALTSCGFDPRGVYAFNTRVSPEPACERIQFVARKGNEVL